MFEMHENPSKNISQSQEKQDNLMKIKGRHIRKQRKHRKKRGPSQKKQENLRKNSGRHDRDQRKPKQKHMLELEKTRKPKENKKSPYTKA